MAVTPSFPWNWEPSILIGLALFSLGYAWTVSRLRHRFQWGPPVIWQRQIAFHTGTCIAFLALCSPIDSLGDKYLFSAHMLQHMLLIFAAAPLWLIGTPVWLVLLFFPAGRARALLHQILSPLAAFMIFNGVLGAWHVPAAYDFALQHEAVHIFEHLTFIAAALAGWGPALLDPPVVSRSGLARALYLFFTTLPSTGLAALLALSPRLLYPFYESAPRAWGLSALADQQLGGLLMGLPGNIIFVIGILLIAGHRFAKQEEGGSPQA